MNRQFVAMFVSSLVLAACAAEPPRPSATGSLTPPSTATPAATLPPTATPVPFVQSGELWARAFQSSTTGGTVPHVLLDEEGNILTAFTMGNSGSVPQTTSANLGGGQLVGRGGTDFVVGRFSPDGNHVWSRLYGGMRVDILGAMELDDDESILVVGSFEETLDLGNGAITSNGKRDAFVARLDAAGEHIWSVRFGGPGNDYAWQLVALPNGDLVVAGSFEGTGAFGAERLVANGPSDAFVARLSPSGDVRWVRQLGDGAYDGTRDLRVDPLSGDLLVALAFVSDTRDERSLGLVRLTSEGVELWSRRFDGELVDPEVLRIDADGTILLAGDLRGPVDFGGDELVSNGWEHDDPAVESHYATADVFLAKFGSDGEHIWSTRFGDASEDWVSDIAITEAGDILVSGGFRVSLNVGGDTERIWVERTGSGGYVARFAETGAPLAVTAFTDGGQITGVGGLTLGVFEDSDDLLISGRFFDRLDLGFGQVTTRSDWLDFFIARIEAP